MGALSHSILPRRPVVPARFPVHEVIDDDEYLLFVGTIRITLGGQYVGGRPHAVFACFNILDHGIAVTGAQSITMPIVRLVTIGMDERRLRFPAETHVIEGVQYEGFEIFNWAAIAWSETMLRTLDRPDLDWNSIEGVERMHAMIFWRLHDPFLRAGAEGRGHPPFGSSEVAPLIRPLVQCACMMDEEARV